MSATFKMSDGTELDRQQTINAIRNKNSQVIKEITTSDFEDGGKLNRQQFAEFFQQVQDEAQLLDTVRTEPLDGPEYQIDRLGIGDFNLRAVGEGESAATRDIDTSKVDIDVVKVSLPYELTRETVEDTIEYENTAEIILQQFSQVFGFETEYLAWQGDEAYDGTGDEPQDFLNINDGWFQVAADEGAASVDAEGGTLDEDHLFDATYEIEDKYLRAADPVFMCHPKQAIAYRQSLSARETPLGDEMLTGDAMPTPTGYNIVTSSAMPSDAAMFTDPSNLVYAVHRDMRVDVTTESEKVVMNDLFAQYNLTARFDFVIEDEDAVVTIDNLGEPSA